MNRCGGCRFWGRFEPSVRGYGRGDQTGEWRQCGRVVHDLDSHTTKSKDGFEANDRLGQQEKVEIRQTRQGLAVVEDGSDFYAVLKCCKDFGCVLFEPLDGDQKDSEGGSP